MTQALSMPPVFPGSFAKMDDHVVVYPVPSEGDMLGVRGQRAGGPAGPMVVNIRLLCQVMVLEVAGRLSDVEVDLEKAIRVALADGPRALVCDLSAVPKGVEQVAVEMLATAGRHVRDWPGIPLAVACPDPDVRKALGAHPMGRHLIVTSSTLSAMSTVLATPTVAVQWLRLAPQPTAARASRNFVSRTLLDWGLAPLIPAASLVISELVTNSTIHAGTDIDLSIAWHLGDLRLTVRDGSPDLPCQRHPHLDVHGRGLSLVLALSRGFGVLPTTDGGKVVWAVLDAPRRRPRAVRTQSQANLDQGASPP